MPVNLFFLTSLIALEHLRHQNPSEPLTVGVRLQSGSIMSNFEPNAVIRGFQLTVVGSLSPILPLCRSKPADKKTLLIRNSRHTQRLCGALNR